MAIKSGRLASCYRTMRSSLYEAVDRYISSRSCQGTRALKSIALFLQVVLAIEIFWTVVDCVFTHPFGDRLGLNFLIVGIGALLLGWLTPPD